MLTTKVQALAGSVLRQVLEGENVTDTPGTIMDKFLDPYLGQGATDIIWFYPHSERAYMLRKNDMEADAQVEVRLHGDDRWYHGTVIKARKQWVQLSNYKGPMIADENNIAEWRSAKQNTEAK